MAGAIKVLKASRPSHDLRDIGPAARKLMALHHKLCHRLGSLFDLPHAQTHAIVLPHAVAYNAEAAPEAMAAIRRALGPGGAAQGLFDLLGRLGLPRALSEIGMLANDIARRRPRGRKALLESAPDRARRHTHPAGARACRGEPLVAPVAYPPAYSLPPSAGAQRPADDPIQAKAAPNNSASLLFKACPGSAGRPQNRISTRPLRAWSLERSPIAAE